MPAKSHFQCARLLVIESLEPTEFHSGRALADYVTSLDFVRSHPFLIEYRTCENANEFRALLAKITREVVETNLIPLLHVECHGDAATGLEFANGSTVAWSELSSLLVELNKATRFNLVATFAACYGGHFLGELESTNPAPVYAMLAPTEAVDPAEIFAGSRLFYSTLFHTREAGDAIDALSNMKLSSGEWFAQHAERWFERVTLGYVENYCTSRASRIRCRKLFHQLKREGHFLDMSEVKAKLREANRVALLGNHFDTFFMTDSVPENRLRFKALRMKMEQAVDRLRSTGRYII